MIESVHGLKKLLGEIHFGLVFHGQAIHTRGQPTKLKTIARVDGLAASFSRLQKRLYYRVPLKHDRLMLQLNDKVLVLAFGELDLKCC